MYSNIVPFENIIDAVKDETGITNLRNLYPTIRRLVYRIERDLGFGHGLLIKKIPYSVKDGTIYDNKIRLPRDLIFIEAVGTCENGLCPNCYIHQGNYLFLCCDNITSFDLVYYTMLCDGEGNPAITENHFDAVVAGVVYYLAKPKKWNKEITLQDLMYYQQYYFDRIGESIGQDMMPTTKDEWSQIAGHLKMSYRDILIYDNEKDCYKCVPYGINHEVIDPDFDASDDLVYWWQYPDLASDSSLAPSIDQAFLDLQNKDEIAPFLVGYVIAYELVGRIGFAITNINEDDYKIVDVFQQELIPLVFDSYYNTELRTQIFISKEYYSHGNIYFQLIKN
jgi:hypothetical protein